MYNTYYIYIQIIECFMYLFVKDTIRRPCFVSSCYVRLI